MVVAGGRIYALKRPAYAATTIQEYGDGGGPRGQQFVIKGPSVDRLVPAGDDLLVIVRDGHTLKFWAHTPVGTLRQAAEGGQKTLGEGETLAPPVWADGRVVCMRADAKQLHVACAMVGS